MTHSQKHEVLLYCSKYLDYMWASTIVSILLECDFRDSKEELEKYFIEYGT